MRKKVHIGTSVYYRVLVLTTAVILVFYGIGLYLNGRGRANVIRDLERSIQSESEYIIEEMERELNNLVQMQQEYLSDSLLLRLVITHDVMSDYQRTEAIRNLFDQLARIKRFSPLIDTAFSYLPQMDVYFTAGRPVIDEMDPELKRRMMDFIFQEDGQIFEYENQLIMPNCFPYRRKRDVLGVIGLTFSPETILQRMAGMRNAEDSRIALLRGDGSAFALMAGAEALLNSLPGQDILDKPMMLISGGVNYMAVEREIGLLGLR